MHIDVVLKPLPAKDSEGRTLWEVVDDVFVHLAPNCYLKVPAGFVSNLGTIPRWAYPIINLDYFAGPFVVHDYLCNEDVYESIDTNSGYSRWLADAILYETMVNSEPKAPFWKCWIVWAAVRFYARVKGLR